MMCQCRFFNCNKCPTLGSVVVEEAVLVGEEEVYRKSLSLLPNFAVNLKLL